MAPAKLKKPTMHLITLSSKQRLSGSERDFIAELVSEEARKTRGHYSFILHDILESKKCSQIIIEGTSVALGNLLSVIKGNLPYEVTCSGCGK